MEESSMENAETPIRKPIRRLGLTRSVKRVNREEINPNTPKWYSTSRERCSPSNETSTPLKLRPIKGTCSADDSDDDESSYSSPATPARNKSSFNKTRLSLSVGWRNKITHKKQLNFKRRKLMDGDEFHSEPHEDEKGNPVIETDSRTDLSKTKQKIIELKQSIKLWREGCIKALDDLHQRQGTGTMESILDLLEIPHNVVNYDSTNQVFLDPD